MGPTDGARAGLISDRSSGLGQNSGRCDSQGVLVFSPRSLLLLPWEAQKGESLGSGEETGLTGTALPPSHHQSENRDISASKGHDRLDTRSPLAESPQISVTFPASFLRDTRLPVFPVSAGSFPLKVRLSRRYSQPAFNI